MTGIQAPARIGQTARQVRNCDAATCWHADVLMLPHLYSFGTLSFFDCDGAQLFISGRTVEAVASNSVLYFVVSDTDVAHRDLESRCAHFPSGPHLIHRHNDCGQEWMAVFDGCEGGTSALMSKKAPAR